MTDVLPSGPVSGPAWGTWPTRLIASRRFQKWAAGFPLTRRLVRREGEVLFDILAGFCHSQVLMALVRLEIPQALLARPQTALAVSLRCSVPLERMEILLRASVALGLVRRKSGARFALTRTGAALVGVPGLAKMIDHHDVLYRDLADPVAFFRGEGRSELAAFWPYVFGGQMDPEAARTYSDLMADSQVLVAEDTLRAASFQGVSRLMDVGGGSGAFLEAVGRKWPDVGLSLFDLPEVAPLAQRRFEDAGMADRFRSESGSFRTADIPKGADAISLIRVLYDHSDETVADLLGKCWDALPDGGQLIISEPMLGDARPERAGDVYFALYTLAMETGKARSVSQIEGMCVAAGFEVASKPRPLRAFVTRCLVVRKCDT